MLPMYVGSLGLSWFFVNCYALFYRVASLWYVCCLQRKNVFVRPLPNAYFLVVTGLWGSGRVSLLASKMLSTVFGTSHSSCVFLYLFSSANISPVRYVFHWQDWWCVGKRETSFPVNELWLINLPPSLWPLTNQCKSYITCVRKTQFQWN